MSGGSIVILGAGAWGTALAVTLSRAGREVTLCPHRAEQAAALERERENRGYLPGIELPPNLRINPRWEPEVAVAKLIIVAIPSQFVRACLTPLGALFAPDAIVVSATKGLEEHTLGTMTQTLAEILPSSAAVAALSGPGFAVEIARGKPAALVAAARDPACVRMVQRLLAQPLLRIYRSSDVIGVELGGALKNVIAIAAGIGDGLALGLSARAAVITRGLAEMIRLGNALGARTETLAGLSGLGDLVLTCTSELSRNHAWGLAIGAGRLPRLAPGQVAEGVVNTRLLAELGARAGVELPLVEAVGRCLYEEQPPRTIVENLLSRELKAEF
ncbi:MAG TPA: NAD(P)H-dependent glycerol-3-phosphate dehydrogenase [Candidatus Binataceae bacterium]|nr:NAD(P)H-dependent glycerol-3-phosphate dehydrogenase [Candidatus Binataceae bacterium]